MNRKLTLFVAAMLLAECGFAASNRPSDAPKAGSKTLGSTVVVGQDSAMGLTLMPWKEEYATGLDQAPTLYRAPLSPLNADSLQRQTEYRDNLNNYRRTHSQYTQ